MSDAEKYMNFYVNSVDGRGLGGNFKPVRLQKGDGLGSFLAGAFRRIFPLLKSGAKAFGDELLTTGVGMLRDGINGKSMKTSVRERVTAAGNNLTKRAANKLESMVGSGLKTRKRRKKCQSRTGSKRKRKAPKRKPRKKKDIFA